MTVIGRGFKELFKNPISKMKMYRVGGVVKSPPRKEYYGNSIFR